MSKFLKEQTTKNSQSMLTRPQRELPSLGNMESESQNEGEGDKIFLI